MLLSTHPSLVGQVVLIQVAIPTRGDVEEYRNLRTTVNELIGRINGKFGGFSYTPIHFLHRSVPFEELIALYALADVCVVTSTRDGMNLVSFEYVACQAQRHGSLILSEFAGSAQRLSGALVVNPWNEEELARAMWRAVSMGGEEREGRWRRMERWVGGHTSAVWGEEFVKGLSAAGEEGVEGEKGKGMGGEGEERWLRVTSSTETLPQRVDWRMYD